MWDRGQIKEIAKSNFKRFYKQTVIVCFILYLIGAVLDSGFNSPQKGIQTTVTYKVNGNYNQEELNANESITNNFNFFENKSIDGLIASSFDSIINAVNKSLSAVSMSIIILVMVCIILIAEVVRFIIYNPLIIGKNNFFMGTREEERKIGDIFFLFDKKHILKPIITMFFVDLFTFLWTLLLLIPGIIKSYEYKMIPYVLAENPDIDRQRAFELSRHMMDGQKWDTFVLDLSFWGWHILSSFTFGLLSIFYVSPYVESTYAELYAVLRQDALQSQFASYEELPGFNKELI